jgi:hypothetical protein
MKNKIKVLMIIISLIAAIFMLTRCVATKKQKANFLAKHCERKDSISYVKKDSIVYKDSLIYIPQIINTPIYLENPCKLLCDSLGNIKKVNIVTNKGGLKSTLKTVGNSLIFECETDSLKARIKWLEHNQIITEKSHTENTVKIPCELKHRTGFDGFCRYYFFITFSLILIVLLIRFFLNYIGGYITKIK